MTDDFTSGLPGIPETNASLLAPREAIEAAIRAAVAAGPLLPSPDPLVPGEPVASAATLPLAGGGAVLAKLGHGIAGEMCLLVSAELVDALAESPLGALDLVPSVQSALDAAAASLGGRAEAGRGVEAAIALDTSEEDIQVVVPLMADGFAQAALIVRARPDLINPNKPAHDGSTESDDDLGAAAAGGIDGSAAVAAGAAVAAAAVAAAAAGVDGSVTGALATAAGRQPARRSGLDLLHDVAMEVTVELGRTRMTVRDLLGLSPGSLIELDRAAGSPADLLVHGTLLARGEIVVIDEEFGLRITEIVTDESAGS